MTFELNFNFMKFHVHLSNDTKSVNVIRKENRKIQID